MNLVPSLWAGLIFGGGILSILAIFDVPSAEKSFAYSAAARVFERVAVIEWGFLGLILLGVLALKFPPKRTLVTGVIAVIFILQELWLHPVLSERASVLADGGQVEASLAHPVFAVLSVVKLILLIGLSFSELYHFGFCRDRAVFAPSK
ncbi:MAG: hypothetical protein VXA00_09600 [Rhodospirillales bacterium]|jgi:hypothetical protein